MSKAYKETNVPGAKSREQMDKLDQYITEEQFQQQIIDLAHTFGWVVAHFRPAMTNKGWRTPVSADGKGFPDLVLAKKGRKILFWEAKKENEKLSPSQSIWLELLGGRVVKPSQWEEIVGILGGER